MIRAAAQLLGTVQVLAGQEKKDCSYAQPKKTTFEKCTFNCKVANEI
jgi:hypothetical protein